VKITFDEAKREQTLAQRGLDFADAAEVFEGLHTVLADDRFDYAETRYISAGHLRGRMVVIVWTPRGDARHIISMRYIVMRRKKRVGASTSKGSLDRDDAPELTDEHFERADIYRGARLVRRGRPRLERPKRAVKLRLDQDVLDHFRASGPGWQTRINATLARAVARAKR